MMVLQTVNSYSGGISLCYPWFVQEFHGHPYKPGMLNSLGNSFITRFKRLWELSDLEDAIPIVDSPCAILGSFIWI
ncbi:hypothetical protein L210DRAFT_3519682 [Boletus edulis BED1]|uniref:Uncharacterized protein n=1 Tax=Boletus edulis BED1 TaxID=1328754 RepID=A0AAD4BD36_BOLED|nr:hypothetical protein L210DRAFT_3577771 [Boletus edulis BED1]KAF8452829.1 hypothetical protein L210DRAFT_3519682 [Boletus edulis BED1]